MREQASDKVGAFDGTEVRPLDDMRTSVGRADAGARFRFRKDLGDGGVLDAALLAQDSDTLVVTFHGLLDRDRFHIPRFERARSTEPFGTSCLYWADPSLWLDPKLKLAWFTGVAAIDLHVMIAEQSLTAAAALGARRVLFTGSSGGGFAALQVSALVPGSTALVFNPQTEIYRYLTSIQRRYLRNCRPDVLHGSPADAFDFTDDWSAPLGPRYSAIRRYSGITDNRVIYYSNSLDWHDEKHRQPFEDVANAVETGRVVVHTYEQAGGHQPPSAGRFTTALEDALARIPIL